MDWLKNLMTGSAEQNSRSIQALRLVWTAIMVYGGYQITNYLLAWNAADGSFTFAAKAMVITGLVILYKYLGDKFFDGNPVKNAIANWTWAFVKVSWAPLAIGVSCYLTKGLHDFVYLPVSHHLDEMVTLALKHLGADFGMGWAVLTLSLVAASAATFVLRKYTVYIPVITKDKWPSLSLRTHTADVGHITLAYLSVLLGATILVTQGKFSNSTVLEVVNYLKAFFSGEHVAGYPYAVAITFSMALLGVLGVRYHTSVATFALPHLQFKARPWISLEPLSIGFFVRLGNLITKVNPTLIAVSALMAAGYWLSIVPASFEAAIPPAVEMVLKAALIGWPIYLYIKYGVFSKGGSQNYATWFFKLAKPHWVGTTPSHWLTWVYFAFIVANIWLVVQLNSSLQDSLVAIKSALVNKDVTKYNEAYWDSIKIFFFAILYMPLAIWIRSKAFMHWRQHLTRMVAGIYLSIDQKYFGISGRDDIDNPDERIHEDLQEFTERTYGLTLAAADAILTLVTFTSKLWLISPVLGLTSIAYALVGTIGMFLFTTKMVALMNNQKRLEANFRYYLIFIRILAESIAFFRGEKRELAEVNKRFDRIVVNYNNLIAWTRRQNYLVKAYSYMDYFVVLLIMAPLWFAGKIEYGLIDGAQMAFGMVLGSLSLFVTEFVTLSRLAVTTERAGKFLDALQQPAYDVDRPVFNIIEETDGKSIVIEGGSIWTPQHPRLLIKDLKLTISPENPVIFVGPSGSGKTSAFRAVAGLWHNGEGTIKRPPLSEFMFLPQRPYMSVGTLRDQILYPFSEDMKIHRSLVQPIIDERRARVSDEEIRQILIECGLPNDFIDRYPNGLDEMMESRSWGDRLSPGEQQRVSFARVLITKPKIVFADEATAAVDPKNERKLYRKLKELGVTYASVGHRPGLVHYHAQVIELFGDNTGGWRSMTPAEYEEKQKQEALLDD